MSIMKILSFKNNNLAYIKFNKALTESDKVLALTKSKYLTAKKQHTTISSKMLNQTLDTPGKNLAEKSIIDQKITSQGMELGD